MSSNLVRAFVFVACLTPLAQNASAQITVSPSTVNVNKDGATTAFLTFRGLGAIAGSPAGPVGPAGPSTPAASPAEAYWCGGLIAATPAKGQKCDSATIYGQLPAGLSQSQVVAGVFTDIMSMPASIARRAVQAAEAGGSSTFYYVRRFTRAGRPDEYSAVTLRLTGSGTAAFALTDVLLSFAVDAPVLFLDAGAIPPSISATLRYTGTGQLVGRWEIVRPGEDLPAPRDLLTEGTLPAAERGTQRRFSELSRFNEFLSPTGRYVLAGPEPARLPTGVDGTYFVLLRIEAGNTGSPTAGFSIPVLRYIVSARGTAIAAHPIDAPVVPLSPAPNAKLLAGRAMDFGWVDVADTAFYRLEVEREEDGTPVFSAIVPSNLPTYRAPSWLAERAGPKPLRWRVVAVDATGRTIGSSPWRRLETGK